MTGVVRGETRRDVRRQARVVASRIDLALENVNRSLGFHGLRMEQTASPRVVAESSSDLAVFRMRTLNLTTAVVVNSRSCQRSTFAAWPFGRTPLRWTPFACRERRSLFSENSLRVRHERRLACHPKLAHDRASEGWVGRSPPPRLRRYGGHPSLKCEISSFGLPSEARSELARAKDR